MMNYGSKADVAGLLGAEDLEVRVSAETVEMVMRLMERYAEAIHAQERRIRKLRMWTAFACSVACSATCGRFDGAVRVFYFGLATVFLFMYVLAFFDLVRFDWESDKIMKECE